MSGDPTPSAITLWTRLRRRRRAASASSSRSRATASFRHVVARKRVATAGGPTTRSRRASPASSPTSSTTTASPRATTDGPVGRFRTALPADSRAAGALRVLLLPGLHARLLQRARAPGRTRTSTSSSASATTSTPRPTTRRRAAPACATTRSAATGPETHDIVREAVTLDRLPREVPLYRSDPALRARPRAVPDGHALGRPRGAGQLRGRRARRRPAAREALQPAPASARRYKAFFESMPVLAAEGDRIYRTLRFGRTVDLIVMDQRQYRADQPCDDAVAPAVRRATTSRATSSAARRWTASRTR